MSKVICVVDDHATMRQMLRLALGMNGLRVVEAVDGDDALATLAATPVDLLIIDWQMPNMDGLECVRRLRGIDDYAELPIVMLSCRDDLSARQEARALGVLVWLKKPFRIAEIQQVVESALGLTSPLPSRHFPGNLLAGYL